MVGGTPECPECTVNTNVLGTGTSNERAYKLLKNNAGAVWELAGQAAVKNRLGIVSTHGRRGISVDGKFITTGQSELNFLIPNFKKQKYNKFDCISNIFFLGKINPLKIMFLRDSSGSKRG